MAALLWIGCASSGSALVDQGAATSRTQRTTALEDSPPAPGPSPPLHFPSVTHARLANGLPVWVVEEHAIPRVVFLLAVLAGSDGDPPDQAGLAALTADMLDEGAGGRSALAVAEALADAGADLRIWTSPSASYLELWSPEGEDTLRAALSVLGDSLVEPAFAPEELRRVRDARLDEFLQREDHPEIMADELLARAIYGAKHPYGRPVSGGVAALSASARLHVRRFWREYYRPDNAVMIVVGATTEQFIVPMLSEALDDWKAAPSPRREPPPPPDMGGPRLVIVDRPGAGRSSVRLGHVGIGRAHPDAFLVEVLGKLLSERLARSGGGMGGRLERSRRAWGGFETWRGPGPFVVGATVGSNETADAVGGLLSAVRRICEEVPEERDVARARDGLLRGIPARFEGASQIASRLADLFLHDLPDDYYDEYVARVRAVTPADVRRAACEHVRPDDLQIVVVSDRSVVEEGLAALGLGAPLVWSAEGEVVP